MNDMKNNGGIKCTKLKRIFNPKGDIFHALKASEDDSFQFGEAYFSMVNENEIKGWKKHSLMVMNLIVPVGDVTFYIFDEVNNIHSKYRLNADNYIRLTVPPGYWMAFEGHDDAHNLVLNIASMEHDPNESKTVDINQFLLG